VNVALSSTGEVLGFQWRLVHAEIAEGFNLWDVLRKKNSSVGQVQSQLNYQALFDRVGIGFELMS
jgi:hypothetical protein